MQRELILEVSFFSKDYETLEVYGDKEFRFKCLDECRRYPTCCRGGRTHLIPTDFSELARHFGLSNEDFFQKYCKLLYEEASESKNFSWYFVTLKEGKNGYCVLLDTGRSIKSCSVHEKIKPYNCRSFPLSPTKDAYLVNQCPGYGKGDLHTVQEWAEENKTVEFKKAIYSIIRSQVQPFLYQFAHLSRLIRIKDEKRAKELRHEIKMRQQKIVMEMFEIKI